MKKILLIGIVLFFSCQSKTEKESKILEKNLFTFFQETIRKADNTNQLDSIRLIKIDTITLIQVLFKKVDLIYDKVHNNTSDFHDLEESSNHDVQMARLASGVSDAIYRNSMEDLNAKTDKMQQIHEENVALIKKADSLSKIYATADSVKPVYYWAQCIMQYHRKDLSISRDTVYSLLDLKKNILRKEDVFK